MQRDFKSPIRREVEVAFSKNTQPVWLRLLKYLVLALLVYFFGRRKSFWIFLGITLVLALLLHFFYRHKTAGWTKSWGGWRYEEERA